MKNLLDRWCSIVTHSKELCGPRPLLSMPRDWPGRVLGVLLSVPGPRCLSPCRGPCPLLRHCWWHSSASFLRPKLKQQQQCKTPFLNHNPAWGVTFENILLHSLNGYLCVYGPAIYVLWGFSGNPFSKKWASTSGTMFTECLRRPQTLPDVSDKPCGPMCLATSHLD